jgi:hypothetical protein
MRQVKATVENSELLTRDLKPGRVEPHEDIGRAGADDGIQ